MTAIRIGFIRLCGVTCGLTVVASMVSAVLFHWKGDFRSFNVSLGTFFAALLVAGMTAALDLWISDLTPREKMDQTRSLTVGLGALANTFGFLLAGGAASVRRGARSEHGHRRGE